MTEEEIKLEMVREARGTYKTHAHLGDKSDGCKFYIDQRILQKRGMSSRVKMVMGYLMWSKDADVKRGRVREKVYFSDGYMSDFLGLTKKSIVKSLNVLKNKGLIEYAPAGKYIGVKFNKKAVDYDFPGLLGT